MSSLHKLCLPHFSLMLLFLTHPPTPLGRGRVLLPALSLLQGVSWWIWGWDVSLQSPTVWVVVGRDAIGVHLSSHIRWDHNWSYCWQQRDKNQLFARVSSVRPSWQEPCPLEFNYAAPKWGQFVLGSASLLWLYHPKDTSEQFCTSSLLVALWSSMSLRATKQYQNSEQWTFSASVAYSLYPVPSG